MGSLKEQDHTRIDYILFIMKKGDVDSKNPSAREESKSPFASEIIRTK